MGDESLQGVAVDVQVARLHQVVQPVEYRKRAEGGLLQEGVLVARVGQVLAQQFDNLYEPVAELFGR